MMMLENEWYSSEPTPPATAAPPTALLDQQREVASHHDSLDGQRRVDWSDIVCAEVRRTC